MLFLDLLTKAAAPWRKVATDASTTSLLPMYWGMRSIQSPKQYSGDSFGALFSKKDNQRDNSELSKVSSCRRPGDEGCLVCECEREADLVDAPNFLLLTGFLLTGTKLKVRIKLLPIFLFLDGLRLSIKARPLSLLFALSAVDSPLASSCAGQPVVEDGEGVVGLTVTAPSWR